MSAPKTTTRYELVFVNDKTTQKKERFGDDGTNADIQGVIYVPKNKCPSRRMRVTVEFIEDYVDR